MISLTGLLQESSPNWHIITISLVQKKYSKISLSHWNKAGKREWAINKKSASRLANRLTKLQEMQNYCQIVAME